MKYPVVIPYIHDGGGNELRYALRSLKNVSNFNGEVWIVGDREKWFSDKIIHTQTRRIFGRPYYDQVHKMLSVLDKMPDYFIASQDDVYITKPLKIGFYHQGPFKDENNSRHKRTKIFTASALKDLGFDSPLDFEVHAPVLVNTEKMKQTLQFIRSHPKRDMLQWRSLYGNMHRMDGIFMEDRKTKSRQLRVGDIVSTSSYSTQLEDLFPEPGVYEAAP